MEGYTQPCDVSCRPLILYPNHNFVDRGVAGCAHPAGFPRDIHGAYLMPAAFTFAIFYDPDMHSGHLKVPMCDPDAVYCCVRPEWGKDGMGLQREYPEMVEPALGRTINRRAL